MSTSLSCGSHISQVNVPPCARMLAQPGSDASVKMCRMASSRPVIRSASRTSAALTTGGREGHAEDVVAHRGDVGRRDDPELQGERVVDLGRDRTRARAQVVARRNRFAVGVQSVGVVARRQQQVGVDGGRQFVGSLVLRRHLDRRTAEGDRHVGDAVEHVDGQQVELRVGRELRDVGGTGDGADETVGADVAARRSPTPWPRRDTASVSNARSPVCIQYCQTHSG